MCEDMPTGLCTRWDYNEETHKFSMQDKIEFKSFKQPDLKVKLKATTLQKTEKKLLSSVLIAIATTVRLFLKQWVVIFISVLVKNKKLDLA